MKYIALLRGVNVGGNNKVSMAELRACFESVGFLNAQTYINSGNVIFDSAMTDRLKIIADCEAAIEKQFGFRVICCVISSDELREALEHAPKWWSNGDSKHNALFVIAPKTADELLEELGEINPSYEKIAAYHPIVFSSAPLETFSRTRIAKIVGTKLYQSVTIRNANTANKLLELCRQPE